MGRRTQLVFLLLVLAQAAHSIEEFATRLWEVLPLARYFCSLVSDDVSTGFVIINSLIVAFGLICYLWPVRSGGSAARPLAWLWVGIELVNGVGHLAMAVAAGGYFSGAATAPVLLVLAAWLASLLLRERSVSAER